MKKSKFIFSLALLSHCTFALSQTAMTFGIIGDYGGNNKGARQVAESLLSKKPSFIITLGDNNYPRGCKATIDDNIGQYYSSYIGRYKGNYGEGAKENLFYPTLGNHDWNANTYCPEPDGLPYANYFSLPGNGRYYEFQKQNIHFFAIDSDPHEPDGIKQDSRQYQWLKNRVQKSKGAFKIVYFHHAPYSSSFHGDNKSMQWDFANMGVDVVLAGHDHIYERIERDGILYFVNGIGGADSNYSVWRKTKDSKFIYNKKYGYILATIKGTALTFELFSQDGELIEAKTINKPDANENDNF